MTCQSPSETSSGRRSTAGPNEALASSSACESTDRRSSSALPALARRRCSHTSRVSRKSRCSCSPTESTSCSRPTSGWRRLLDAATRSSKESSPRARRHVLPASSRAARRSTLGWRSTAGIASDSSSSTRPICRLPRSIGTSSTTSVARRSSWSLVLPTARTRSTSASRASRSSTRSPTRLTTDGSLNQTCSFVSGRWSTCPTSR